MLSVSNVQSAGAANSYYASDNYYTSDELKEASVWLGRGAEELGLVGNVDRHVFQEALMGRFNGDELGKAVKNAQGETVKKHVPAYDLTFSAPKSVSLLAEVAGKKDVREAHEAAVTKVAEYIEEHLIGARTKIAGQTAIEKTQKLIAARFAHTINRNGDPQTHTHLVVMNATVRADGKLASVDNRAIYRNQKLLGQLYNISLAKELTDRGYELDVGANGNFEINGFTKEQLAEFSTRTKDIEDYLAKRGLSRDTATAAQRENAALRTRQAKQVVDHEQLRKEWKAKAHDIGIKFETVKQSNQPNKPDRGENNQNAERALEFAIRHLTEKEVVVGKSDLFQTGVKFALREKMFDVTVNRLSDALKVVERTSLIKVGEGYSTRDALAKELSIQNMAENGRNTMKAISNTARVSKEIRYIDSADKPLSQGQADAASLILTTKDQFITIQGYAGVGKTTMLSFAENIAPLVKTVSNEIEFRGFAPTAAAANALQEGSGIKSQTAKSFVMERQAEIAEAIKERKSIPDLSNQVWVMDESSLASLELTHEVMGLANQVKARMVFLGDRAQLQAVAAGKPFEILQKTSIDKTEMSEIHRQKVADLREAVSHAKDHQMSRALASIDRHVIEGPKETLFASLLATVETYGEISRKSLLVIAPKRDDRKALNEAIRAKAQERGDIAADKLVSKVLLRSELSDAEKQYASSYLPNHEKDTGKSESSRDYVVAFMSNYGRMGVNKGDYLNVKEIDVSRGIVILENKEGKRIEWQPEKQTKVEVYEREKRGIAEGDMIRFGRNDKSLGVSNGMTGSVVSIDTKNATISVKAGNEIKQLDIKDSRAQHWDYSYALTVYASQGLTAKATHVMAPKESGRAFADRGFYVALTRAEREVKIYTDDKKALMKLVVSTSDKTSAVVELGIGNSLKSLER